MCHWLRPHLIRNRRFWGPFRGHFRVVWGVISWPQNRTFSRSLLDHVFCFLKTQHFLFFAFFIKIKNRVQIPPLQSEPIFGKHKTLSLFVIFLNENCHRFAKDTWAQIRVLLVCRLFSENRGYFTFSFASDSLTFFKNNSKFGPKTTLFVLALTFTCLVRLEQYSDDNQMYGGGRTRERFSTRVLETQMTRTIYLKTVPSTGADSSSLRLHQLLPPVPGFRMLLLLLLSFSPSRRRCCFRRGQGLPLLKTV